MAIDLDRRPEVRPAPRRTRTSATLLTLIGATANLTAIVTFLNRPPDLSVVLAALVPVGLGVYLLIRHWGRPIGAVAVLACLSIAAGAFLLGRLGPVAASGTATHRTRDETPGDPGGTDPGGTSGGVEPDGTGPGGGPASLAGYFGGQRRLTPDTGVDLERAPRDVRPVDGPNGTVDIVYIDGLLRANGGGLVADLGAPATAGARCAKAGARNAIYFAIPQTPAQYCFETSDHRPAWLRVNDTRYGEYVVLDLKVWTAIP